MGFGGRDSAAEKEAMANRRCLIVDWMKKGWYEPTKTWGQQEQESKIKMVPVSVDAFFFLSTVFYYHRLFYVSFDAFLFPLTFSVFRRLIFITVD